MNEQKITPNLWFNMNAKSAVDYYVSVFDGRITGTSYYPKSSDEGLADFQIDLAGKELTIDFEIRGSTFTAINAGPEFIFNESVSFAVACKDQAEIDYFWGKLSKHPENEQCGWCKDQFGLSWQIIPERMEALIQRPNAYKTMMNQQKIIIEDY